MANRKGLIQGRGDYPLSELGRDQALRTAEALNDFRPYKIFSSPLKRALETAQILNRRHNVEIELIGDLVEYNLGAFEGLTMDEVMSKFPDVKSRMEKGEPFHLLAPGGESDEEADVRVKRALEAIVDSGLPRMMVVAHLGSLERLILQAAQRYGVPGIDETRFPLANCSITRLILGPAKSLAPSFNDVSHLT